MREAVALLEAREPNAKYLAAAELALVPGFELLATAQGGVTRLRQMILLLAVQGRLVARQEGDESANQALNRIRSAEARLIAEGKIKQAKAGSTISDDEVPFEIPAGWAWARLSQLTSILNGRAYSKQELLDAGTPVLRVGNLFTSKHWYYSNLALDEGKYCVAGDLLFAWSASFGPFIWPGPKVIYHYHIWKLSPHSERDLNKSYLYTFLLEKTQEIKASGHGVSMIHMTKEAMEKIVVPVPPLAEQHRIVARVEELMKLCDVLEQSGRLADEQHARLTSTLFDALAASESAHALAENWQRVAEHFDILLDRLEAINAFEQIGIQLAVRGLLVPQDDGDGIGHELRKRHLQAVPAGGQRGRTELTPRSDDDAPFLAPDSWAWASFGEVADVSGGVTLGRKGALALPVTLPYLRVANVQRGRLNLTAEVKTVAIDAAELQRFQLKLGDLLITEGGDWDKVGRTCIWRGEIASCLHQNHIFRARGRTSEWLPEWGELYLNSADARSYFAASAKQTTNLASINMTQLRNCAFPLPPIAEQHRIVARVEELRRLCADLRQRLTKARETQSRLADALVAEVA